MLTWVGKDENGEIVSSRFDTLDVTLSELEVFVGNQSVKLSVHASYEIRTMRTFPEETVVGWKIVCHPRDKHLWFLVTRLPGFTKVTPSHVDGLRQPTPIYNSQNSELIRVSKELANPELIIRLEKDCGIKVRVK